MTPSLRWIKINSLNIISISFIFLPLISSADDSISLGKIIVKKESFSCSTKSRDIFSYQDSAKFIFNSPEEIINYSPSVDLKLRAPYGVQQDVSIRGSIFEDNSVNIDGIEINDPQTGHYDLEIPLTAADLEEARVIKNLQKIDYILKEPESEGILLKTSFGEHALWEELLSFNFPLSDFKNRLSFEHKTSSGDRQDTDFEISTLSLNSLWLNEGKELEFLAGLTKRDFGASNFYSSSFPHEEEHITQRYFSLRGAFEGDVFSLDNTLYFRRHTDKFILNRNNPEFFTNYHTTYVYGLKSCMDFENDLFFEFNTKEEKITSTNLGNHQHLGTGLSFGLREKNIIDNIITFKAGLTYYDKWDYLEDLHLGASRYLGDNLKLRFSYDRIWRIPSFTELYYLSPANIGSDNLEIQKSNNYEAGLDYKPSEDTKLILNYFFKDQKDTIDWVKNVSSDPWHAQNIEDLNTYGVEAFSQIDIRSGILKQINLGYTYLELDKANPYQLSKYVFDHNRHKIISSLIFSLKDIDISATANYAHPAKRDDYITFDLKIQKCIDRLKLSLEGKNILNKDYEELVDIQGAGRWFKLGAEYNF